MCDVVTINCALHPETEHMFNDAMIAKMKRGAYIVNTARGKICERCVRVLAQPCTLEFVSSASWQSRVDSAYILVPLSIAHLNICHSSSLLVQTRERLVISACQSSAWTLTW